MCCVGERSVSSYWNSAVCREYLEIEPEIVSDLNYPERSYPVIKVPLYAKTEVLHVDVSYVLNLYRVEIVPGAGQPVKPLTEEHRAWGVAATTSLDYNHPDFQAYLNKHALIKAATESNAEFGARDYEIVTKDVVSRINDDPKFVDPQKRMLASRICQSDYHSLDCGSQTMLFAAVMRANGVPAQVLPGRWASTWDKENGGYNQGHVLGNFFDDKMGWIPVDQSCHVFGKGNPTFIAYHDYPDISPEKGVKFGIWQFGVHVNYEGPGPYTPGFAEAWRVNPIPLP